MEENKIFCANVINGDMKTLIESAIFKEFGIVTNIVAVVHPKYVDVITNNDDINKKMRCNKMLRHVFNSVSFGGTAWLEEEANIIHIHLRVSYSHPNGGSNGRELGRLLVYVTENKVKYLNY